MIDKKLKEAFAYHMRRAYIPRAYGYNRPRAVVALELARKDVAANKSRYPMPWKPYAPTDASNKDGMRWVEDPERIGLRLVGYVDAEMRSGNIWNDSDRNGWYSDCFQDSTIRGVVYQLPGRNGECRFVAGYKESESEGCRIDFGTVYSEKSVQWYESSGWAGWNWETDARDIESARDAARYANGMAERAAEESREYSTAWQAGSRAAMERETAQDARREFLALMCELKGNIYPAATCRALRQQAESLVETWREVKVRIETLRNGDDERFYFYAGDNRLADAFADGFVG